MKIAGGAAVVTGAASGLGRATAVALAAAGAEVLAVDLPAAAQDVEPVPGVTYVGADVTVPTQVERLFGRFDPLGTPLRVVVNCAGVAPSERIVGRKGVHDIERFARVVQVNLVGSFAVLAHAAQVMARYPAGDDDQRGVVVNTASVAATDGQIGQAAYAASKAGVAGLTLPAARDLAGLGIRVCAIAPGIIDTPMMATVGADYRAGLAAGVPFPPRFGRPEEFARLVLSIVDNDYLNGEVIRLDGALRMAAR
ncbi:SDR family NAD(P)-dependent oxidoreductase [Kribbella sp. CA-253562]|uniref:SDR family NAD(P)-dependent oxidoreductase n=1 Tax=Kribbella sp. CA-253562 TaxID=3239942 RepID=UPI003D94C49A